MALLDASYCSEMTNSSPEIGSSVVVDGLKVNYLEDGVGQPVLLIHGSGPGVTAYANWRGTIPALSKDFRVLAPDMVGFGYTERPSDVSNLDSWVDNLVGFMRVLDLGPTHIVGNSFGGALALAMAVRHPDMVDRLVLMGSVGLEFELTAGLDAVWGYVPSVEEMDRMLRLFVYDESIITPELARTRYEASVRPGFQEAYSALFPAPRQSHVDALATDETLIAALNNEVLIVHGREDKVIPAESSIRLHQLISRSQLHIFGRCGHWTQIEQQSRFVSLVRSFLMEASGGQSEAEQGAGD